METISKRVEQTKVDVKRALEGVGRGRVVAMHSVKAHEKTGDTAKLYADLSLADDLLYAGQEALERIADGLPSPSSLPLKSPGTGSLDLSALSTFGSDDSRELLALLDRAQEVAERIDAARGYTVGDSIPLHPGESQGTDLAESVSLLALRVRREAEGGWSPHE